MTRQTIFDLKLTTLQQKLAELEEVLQIHFEKDHALRRENAKAHDKINEAHQRVDAIIKQLEELRRAG